MLQQWLEQSNSYAPLDSRDFTANQNQPNEKPQTNKQAKMVWVSGDREGKVTQTHQNKGSVPGGSQGQLLPLGEASRGCAPLSRTLHRRVADFGDGFGSE